MSDFPIQIPVPASVSFPPVPAPGAPSLPPDAAIGQAGLNAYQLAVLGAPGVPPFVGTMAEWLQGIQGQSAYALWKAQPGNEAGAEQDFLDSMDGDSVEFNVSSTHIQWRVVGAPTWLDLIPLAALVGPASTVPGPTIELRTNSTHVQWRVVGAPSWIDLVTLASLTGAASTTAGPAVELQAGSTHVQWRVVGASTWIDLIPIASLVGPASTVPGPAIEMQVSVTHIQWRVVGAGAWTDLVALSTLQGPPGSADASATFIAGKLVEWATTQDLTLGNLGGGESGIRLFKAATLAAARTELGTTIAYCTSALVRNNVTGITLTDDSVMVLPLEANTIYEITTRLSFTTTTSAPGHKWAVMFSAALTGTNGNNGGEYSPNGAAWTNYGVVSSTGVGDTIVRAGSSTNYVWKYRAIIETAAACNIKVQWAQNTSDANNVTRNIGSYLRAEKIYP